MTGSIWIAILCALAIGAGASYKGMKKMSAPLPEYKVPEERVVAPPSQPRVVETRAKSEAPVVVKRDWDSLWKDSLFQDDRTEDDAEVTQTENAPQVSQNVEFELVGLARLGRKDAQVPVAIIVQSANNQRNRFVRRPGMPPVNVPGGGMQGRFPGRMPPGGFQRMQPPVEQKVENAPTEPADKSLYRVGDTIAKTDYKVKAIIMEESKVILTQNNKETVLVLDEKNTNNSVRREKVKREELAIRDKYKQAENKTAKETTPQGSQNVRENMPMGRNMPVGVPQPPHFTRNMNGVPQGGVQPPVFGGNMPNVQPGPQGGPPNFGGNMQGGQPVGGFRGNGGFNGRGNPHSGR